VAGLQSGKVEGFEWCKGGKGLNGVKVERVGMVGRLKIAIFCFLIHKKTEIWKIKLKNLKIC